ncbi:MAG: hypothetical protein AAFO95_07845, partial [Cyanobacteria bacterium J06600_6]
MSSVHITAKKHKSEDHSLRPYHSPQKNKNPNPGSPKWSLLGILFIGLILLIGKIMMSEKELPPGLVPTPDGDYVLSPDRQAKLEKELEEMDNAMQ